MVNGVGFIVPGCDGWFYIGGLSRGDASGEARDGDVEMVMSRWVGVMVQKMEGLCWCDSSRLGGWVKAGGESLLQVSRVVRIQPQEREDVFQGRGGG